MQDIIPDLEPALKSKNPQVKEGTLKFLARSLSSATVPIQSTQIKPLADSLASLLEDGYEGARNEAATSLGCLMKMVGERPLNAVMENLVEVRKSKVKEAYEKATVKCKASGAVQRPVASAPTVAKKPTPTSKPIPTDQDDSDNPPKPAAKPPTKPLVS